MGSRLRIKLVFRFIAVVLLQALIFNQFNLFGFINPMVYLYFIILYPINSNRLYFIAICFFLGLTMDMFAASGGVHAAACTFIAWFRLYLLKYTFGVSFHHKSLRIEQAPINLLFSYVLLITIIHHLIVFWVEAFTVAHILLILKQTLFTGIASFIFLLVLLQLTRSEKA